METSIGSWIESKERDWYRHNEILQATLPRRHAHTTHEFRCPLCSYKQSPPDNIRPVFHRHFSTRQLRILMGVGDKEGSYFCPSCKNVDSPGKIHQQRTTERRRVIVSNCTLHNHYLSGRYEGDIIHIDYCTIPMATIEELEHAYRVDYLNSEEPADVVLVAGLNNIARNEDEDQIMERIRKFAVMVTEESKNYNKQGRSSFAVATLTQPPKLAWEEDDGPSPYPRHRNFKEVIKRLNGRIILFNNALRTNDRQPPTNQDTSPETSQAPQFHNIGIKTRFELKEDKWTPVTQHEWKSWKKEGRRSLITQLNSEERAKMGRMINKYFMSQIHGSNT